jgi:tyramine---L-glutamate ligase
MKKPASSRVFLFEFLSGGGVIDDDPSAGTALLPQGIAMRDAITADLLDSGDCDLTVATFDGASAPPQGALAVAAQRGEDSLAFVVRLARRHDAVWVVAPESGGVLAAFERGLRRAARWIGCDAAAIALASSKAATVERLHAQGVRTPLAAALAGAGRARWVVKPDDGAGAIDTRVHATLDAAQRDAAQRRGKAPPWVEPWVEGAALSLSLLCRLAGAELLSVNRQRIGVDAGGTVSYQGVEIDVLARGDARWPALAALARRVAEALPGLRGFVGVDVVWHDALGPVAIEVNPRATCAYVGLSQRLQRNLAAEVLQCVM